MKLKIKKLTDSAIVPSYAYLDDAGFDLYTNEDITLGNGKRSIISTGIAMEIPKGYAGLIWDKSGLSTKHGLKTLGGVVDSGYRGEIKVGMVNLGDTPYTFRTGEKIAQMIIQRKEVCEIEESDELDNKERGDKGFGSSGK